MQLHVICLTITLQQLLTYPCQILRQAQNDNKELSVYNNNLISHNLWLRQLPPKEWGSLQFGIEYFKITTAL
jgi:hypothetical protein